MELLIIYFTTKIYLILLLIVMIYITKYFSTSFERSNSPLGIESFFFPYLSFMTGLMETTRCLLRLNVKFKMFSSVLCYNCSINI